MSEFFEEILLPARRIGFALGKARQLLRAETDTARPQESGVRNIEALLLLAVGSARTSAGLPKYYWRLIQVSLQDWSTIWKNKASCGAIAAIRTGGSRI